MQIVQRYATAAVSSNLKNDEHHTATDVLAAVALSSDIGHLLFRLKYCNDRSVYGRLLDAWVAKIGKKAARRGWLHNAERVAVAALQHWINDVCPSCSGRGHKKMPDAPMLCDEACELCNGSGKRALRCDDDIVELVKDSLQMLDSLTYEAGGNAMRKLADNMQNII